MFWKRKEINVKSLTKYMILKNLSKNLKRCHASHTFGCEYIAEYCGMTRSQVCNYENGKTMPSAYALYQLARFWGVTTDWLLGIEKEKPIE